MIGLATKIGVRRLACNRRLQGILAATIDSTTADQQWLSSKIDLDAGQLAPIADFSNIFADSSLTTTTSQHEALSTSSSVASPSTSAPPSTIASTEQTSDGDVDEPTEAAETTLADDFPTPSSLESSIASVTSPLPLQTATNNDEDRDESTLVNSTPPVGDSIDQIAVTAAVAEPTAAIAEPTASDSFLIGQFDTPQPDDSLGFPLLATIVNISFFATSPAPAAAAA